MGYVGRCGIKVYVSFVYMWYGCVSLHRLWQQISSLRTVKDLSTVSRKDLKQPLATSCGRILMPAGTKQLQTENNYSEVVTVVILIE